MRPTEEGNMELVECTVIYVEWKMNFVNTYFIFQIFVVFYDEFYEIHHLMSSNTIKQYVKINYSSLLS
jgi:hypothetical protein